MDTSPEIIHLLKAIMIGDHDSPSLAKWLAENSLHFLESPNEQDRLVIADLDAALGEIQRGNADDKLLTETAALLVKGLHLALPATDIVVHLCGATFETVFGTASTNAGGTSMAAAQVDFVPTSA
ncbi:MAG: hypothetical protein HY671_12080 [Chloroflexi bacterium]|nr:hypothetical protein [Chloroflexota bacterium]